MNIDQAKEVLENLNSFLTLNNGNTLNIWLNTALYQTIENMLNGIVKKDNPEDKTDPENKNDDNTEKELPLVNNVKNKKEGQSKK